MASKKVVDFSSASFQKELSSLLAIHRPSSFKFKPRKRAAILIPLCNVEFVDPKTGVSQYRPSILFSVRSYKLRSHSGEVSFPGGVYDKGADEDSLEKTAIRETKEEITSVNSIEILGSLPSVPDKTYTILVTPFVGYIGTFSLKKDPNDVGNEYGITWNKDEVADVFFMSLDELFDPTRRGLQTIKDTKLKLPYWIGPERNIQQDMLTKDTRLKSQNAVLCDGKWCWGLSAYVLDYFLKHFLTKTMAKL